MELTARIHIEEGSCWADESGQSEPLHVATATLTDQPFTAA